MKNYRGGILILISILLITSIVLMVLVLLSNTSLIIIERSIIAGLEPQQRLQSEYVTRIKNLDEFNHSINDELWWLRCNYPLSSDPQSSLNHILIQKTIKAMDVDCGEYKEQADGIGRSIRNVIMSPNRKNSFVTFGFYNALSEAAKNDFCGYFLIKNGVTDPDSFNDHCTELPSTNLQNARWKDNSTILYDEMTHYIDTTIPPEIIDTKTIKIE